MRKIDGMIKTVLLILPTLEIGGAEKQALNLAQYLTNRDIRVEIVGLSAPGGASNFCKEHNIQCTQLKYGNRILICLLQCCNVLFRTALHKEIWTWGLPYVFSLISLIRKGKYDVCISYCANANTILGYSKRFFKANCKYVWFQRDAGIQNCPEPYQSRAIEQMDYVFANSISGKEWIRKTYKKDAMIVYNGVSLQPCIYSTEEWFSHLKIDSSYFVATMVANLSSSKDHLTLLKAWKEFIIRGGNGNKILLLAGRFDDKYEELKNYVIKNEVQKNVLFLGEVKDISGLLRISSIFVFSSCSEGSPNAVIEAALAGKTIVATDLPEIREVLARDNYNILSPAGDYKQFADNIMKIYSDMDKRFSIGEKNREKALKQFLQEKNYSILMNILLK